MDNKGRSFLSDCRRDHVNIYNTVAEDFRKHHLWLNSGGVTALVIFFSSSVSDIGFFIKISCIFFAIGTLLSAFSYIWEFFVFYNKLNYFDKKFFPKLQDSDEIIKSKIKEYLEYQEQKWSSSGRSMYWRGVYGVACYLCFFVGILSLLLNLLI